MDARDYAVLALDEKHLPGMPRQVFRRRSAVAPEDPRDRALGEQIVLGVTKNLALLEHLLDRYAARPAREIDPRSRLILLVGLYQLRFLDRVPDHAVVTEAVRQTRRLAEGGLGQASGFVNAVLRQALREPDPPLPGHDEPRRHMEVVLSHPRPVVDKLVALFGEQNAIRLCEHDNRTPPTLLRLNAGKTIDDLRRDDAGQGQRAIAVRPHEQDGIVVVEHAKQADFAAWSDAAIGQVQDATAAAVVPELGVGEGMIALDRCCGVGTKTQQLAAAVNPGGRVFATDAIGARISTLRKLIGRRPDFAHVAAKRAAAIAEMPEEWPRAYDRILIDAPCSNSGVMARRAEARFYQSDADLAELPGIQLAILRDTWPALAPGGVLGYATCSIWPEENAGIVRAFLEATPDAELLGERVWLPSFETDDAARYRDGGYIARLRRRP